MSNKASAVGSNVVNAKELNEIVSRIEVIDELISEMRDDQKEIIQEAKAKGYEPKVLRRVIQLRKVEARTREYEAEMLEAYMALKMEEVQRFRTTTHPIEFDMYYSS